MRLRDVPRKLGPRALSALRRTRTTLGRWRMSDAEVLRYLEAAYEGGVPWDMQSEKEQFRFAQTNRILLDEVIAPAHKVESILEIGCGEGHQSEYLAALCERLTGIDRVAAAVTRARTRVPNAELIVGDLDAQRLSSARDRFDIVTAFEVLYYVKDIPKMLETMSLVGRACMVSYCGPAVSCFERPMRKMGVAGRATFAFGDATWQVAWWRSGG
jgi:SAM-dependent methyltransferase